MQKLQKQITQGRDTYAENIQPEIRQFYEHKDDLTVENNLIMKGNTVIIPAKLREHVMNILHKTHLGIMKTKQLAHDSVFCPNIDQQITNHIERCSICQNNRNIPHK